jgi:hypothetical protein
MYKLIQFKFLNFFYAHENIKYYLNIKVNSFNYLYLM